MKQVKASFDFEKLVVYQKANQFYIKSRALRFTNSCTDKSLNDQLSRAALSIPLNIAEGTGRIGVKDRRHFYVISRGSCFECACILIMIKEMKEGQKDLLTELLELANVIAKMLSSMILKTR